jgi:SAM-dependent methyltransferase
LAEENRFFYDALWQECPLVSPTRFNTWPLVRTLAAASKSRLEVAPGLSPRLPTSGTHFVDLSEVAVARLAGAGAQAVIGRIEALPCADAAFDLVAAFDVIEHAEDDDAAFAELSRVARPGAMLLISAPLHPARWTPFDELVGHGRRYDPRDLLRKIARSGWRVEQSGAFGMQPNSEHVLDFVVWSFRHNRRRALWWYARVILPIALRFQTKLDTRPGIIDSENLDEILLVCRKRA